MDPRHCRPASWQTVRKSNTQPSMVSGSGAVYRDLKLGDELPSPARVVHQLRVKCFGHAEREAVIILDDRLYDRGIAIAGPQKGVSKRPTRACVPMSNITFHRS